MVNVIIIVIATVVMIYGLVDLLFYMSGMTKKHNDAMEGLTINFIKTMKQLHTASAGFGIMDNAHILSQQKKKLKNPDSS